MAKMSKLVSNLNQKAQVLVDHMNSMRQSIKSKVNTSHRFSRIICNIGRPIFKVKQGKCQLQVNIM